jgi:putative membrane protein
VGFLLRSQNWPVGWPLTALAVAACLYHLGGRSAATRSSARRSACFYGGLLALVLAIDSPIDAYADRLFFVHMVQHVLLTMIAPPLLLLGRPWPRVLRSFPLEARRALVAGLFEQAWLQRAARWLGSPLQSFVCFAVVLLGWHVPALYDLTLRSQPVHDLEHGLFFGAGLLVWRHLAPSGRGRLLTDPERVAYGTGAILVGWLLAVVLAFASHPVYAAYAGLTGRPLGLSALADQQLAAGVMWVPACVPFGIAVLVAAYRWLDPAGGRPRRLLVDDLRPRET